VEFETKESGDDMRTCWAALLGNCSDKISGEHILTEGIFLADGINVKGLPWCLDEFKTIGISSLVKKVLCTEHNSQLSDTDVAAIQLRKALCDVTGLSEARKLRPPQNWPVETFTVNGFALERWCLKTLITIAFGGPVPIGETSRPGEPSGELIEIAFGLRKFQPPRGGLYWMGGIGDVVNTVEGVEVMTFTNYRKCIEGARFRFWGLNLLLVLSDGPVAGPFSFTSLDGKQTVQTKTLYRPRRLHIHVHDRLSHFLEFVW
jgi:hypothetical protein